MIDDDKEAKEEAYNQLAEMIEECDAKDSLTTWEREFITSVHNQLKSKKWLSDKQIGILKKIRDKDIA